MNKGILYDLRLFLILWGTQTISTLGTGMTNYALIIWVYGQAGTASSITMLSIFSFLPSILFTFIAGTIADKWDKKRIMLAADLIAAAGTATVFILYTAAALQIWHLYIINFLLSFMNAFQAPASYVATSLLVPKEHYIRVSGLQAFSGSAISILAPALGSIALAFGGLKTVLLFDLAAFLLAFLTLLFRVKIPKVENKATQMKTSFISGCMVGINYLRGHPALLKLILFFAFINFISKMGSYGMLPAMVLGRTSGDHAALGIVQTAVGMGMLAGSIFVTLLKPAKNRIRVIFLSCGISFLLSDVGMSLTSALPLWAAAAFAGNVPMAFLNAYLTAVMRTNVPISLQGRVFSARDTIQYSTIPIGLFVGGVLADHVFQPFMENASPVQSALSCIFGEGNGSGVAVKFFIIGIIGCAASCISLKNPVYKSLEEK